MPLGFDFPRNISIGAAEIIDAALYLAFLHAKKVRCHSLATYKTKIYQRTTTAIARKI